MKQSDVESFVEGLRSGVDAHVAAAAASGEDPEKARLRIMLALTSQTLQECSDQLEASNAALVVAAARLEELQAEVAFLKSRLS
jgi:hypothetical protein